MLSRLTTEEGPSELRVQLEDFDGKMVFAEYSTFRYKFTSSKRSFEGFF